MPQTIHSHSETKHRQPAPLASKDRSCGCSLYTESCCQLDCLTQPNFFGGQLLADTDLTQLLTWSKDKFRLSRFRHGWGVVCGLEVQCDAGSQALRVGPGYALDCCGHDILVCEETTVSLDEACSTLPDPCAVPEKSAKGRSAKEVETIDFFGRPIPKKEVHEKILSLRYAEVPSDFETALGYASSDGTANCQPSRMRESFTPVWVDADQPFTTVESWKSEYDACREVLQKYLAWAESRRSDWSSQTAEKRWENIRSWLLRWIDGTSGIDAHPLHQFCWLRDSLCTTDELNLESLDQYVTNILFWLVQDCRNHFLQTSCSDCPDDHGVPLARVCLWVPRKQKCEVLAIDPYPPYRRPIRLDSWPTKPGQVNIGQAIWQSPEQALALLTGMGLTVVFPETPFQIASDPRTLHEDLASELFVERDQRISLQVLDAQGCLGKRVVGIRWAPTANNGQGTVDQALARAMKAASATRALAEELAKKLHERGTQDKWEEEVLVRAEAAVKATRVVENLAKKLRERSMYDKWEEEALVLSRALEELTKKLRERGKHDKWEDEALELTWALENLTKKLRERAAKP